MSATYNWSIRDGIPNKYGISVQAVADNVRPPEFAYVALFGNDATGNGSRQKPYRTIAKGIAIAGNIIVGAGTYRENIDFGGNSGYCDGDVMLDMSFVGNGQFFSLYGAEVITGSAGGLSFGGASGGNGGNYYKLVTLNNNASLGRDHYKSIFTGVGAVSLGASTQYATNIGNNTFIGLTLSMVNAATIYGAATNSIFYNCNITLNGAIFDYTLFYGCQFRTNTSSGYTAIDDLVTFLTFISANYPTNPGFKHCAFGDPLFNNISVNDFSITSASPAQNLNYDGTFIGALGVGMSIIARAVEADGSFLFSTNVNLTIADDSITFTDDTLDAQIDTRPQLNSLGRVINAIPLFGFNADRNGQYVDSIPDLGGVFNAGETLSQPASYIVLVNSIVYAGATYQPGDRLTTISGTATFTSAAGGQVQEIVEAPERHTIMARFSDGGTMVLSTDALVVGYWYYVISGTATYNTVDYAAGAYFKAVDTSSWSGTATVEQALADEVTLPFQHYDPAFQPTTNNVGDVRTGTVVRGNGDPAYVRGTGFEWPINSRHMQFRYMFKHANLTP
jgi:hypothetical protein